MVLKKRTPATMKAPSSPVVSEPVNVPKPKAPPAPKPKKIELEEGRMFQRKRDGYIYTLFKYRWKTNSWYCTREDEEGRRWRTPEVPAEEMLKVLKEECIPL